MLHLWARKSRCAILVFCLCCGGLPWQSFAQNESRSGGTFKMRVDVDLVTIEVSALDKDGRSARSLKKEDFKLYEEGKQQDILSFDEVSAADVTSPKGMPLLGESGRKRGKTVLMVFMENTISPQNLKLTRDSIAKFVSKDMRPQDLFAVMTYGGSMRVLQNLTGERDDVLAAVDRLAPSMVVSFSFDDLLRSLEQVSYSIARIKGQKSVLFFGPPSLGYTPLDRSRYNKAVNSARQSNVVFYAADPERVGMRGSFAVANQMPSSMMSGRVISGARGGGVVPLTLWNLVSDTGGFIIDNIMDLDSELDRLDQQISNYYVLGFQSNNPKHDGSLRKVDVKTDLKGVTLRHRDSYLDRSPVDVLASSKQEKVLLEALASPGSTAQIPVVLRPMYFYDSPEVARVLLACRIRTEKLTFRKKGGQMAADLNVMGIAYSENGAIAARFSEPLPVSFDPEQEASFRKGSLAYRNYFRLRAGKYRLKIAVSDGSNNLGSIEQALDVPPLPEQTLAGSSIVLVEQSSPLPDLIQNLQNQMLDQGDPLIYSGLQIEPGVDHALPVNSPVRVLFRLYNLSGSPDGWNLVAIPKLINSQGAVSALVPISLKKAVKAAGAGEAAIGLTLPFKDVVPGKYRLVIEINESHSSKPVSIQTDVEFTG